MRKRMRLFLWTLLLAAESFSSTAQSLTLFGGKTYIPGSYAGLRYSHYTNSEVNVAGDLFLENAQTAALRYNSFGLNLMGEYLSTRDPRESDFACRIAIGGTTEIDSEPYVYKDWPPGRRINYGLVGELSGIIHLTEAFSLNAFVQQKYWFNKALGTTNFIFGLAIAFHFDNN